MKLDEYFTGKSKVRTSLKETNIISSIYLKSNILLFLKLYSLWCKYRSANKLEVEPPWWILSFCKYSFEFCSKWLFLLIKLAKVWK